MIFRKKRKQIAEEFVQDAKESIQSSADESLELIFRGLKIAAPLLSLLVLWSYRSTNTIPSAPTATNVTNNYIFIGGNCYGSYR